MGFSIGNLISAVGSLIPGPIGTVAKIVSAGFSSRPSSVGPVSLPSPTSSLLRQASFRGAPTRVAFPVGAAIGRGAGQLALGAAGAVATMIPFFGDDNGTIGDLLKLSRERTGRSATSRKIRDAARTCGLEIAAEMFELSVQQICRVVIETKSRRSRGISASNLRVTRSTIRKVVGISKNLKALSTGRR